MAKSKNVVKPDFIQLDFVIEVLFLALLFFLPTIFDRRLGIVFSGTKVAWMRTFGILMASLWVAKLLIFKQHRFTRTPLDWPVMTFLLCTTIASLTSVHVYTSLVGFYGRYEGLSTWYLFGLFFFLVTNYLHSFEQLERMVMSVLPAASLMAIYSIIQRHALDPYMWGGVNTKDRVIGMIGQPNFLAAYMLMAFFMGLFVFLRNRPSQVQIDWPRQIAPLAYFCAIPLLFMLMIYNLEASDVLLWYSGFFLLTVAALLWVFNAYKMHPKILSYFVLLNLWLIYVSILYTQSRGGYMGLLSAAAVFGLVVGRQIIFADWKKITLLIVGILIISGVTMASPEYSPFERFTSEVTTKKAAVQAKAAKNNLELKGAAGSRGETWKSAFKIIADYPFFGVGPEVLKMVFPRYETDLFRFKEAFHVKQDRCHNEIFDVSATKGLIAFFVYLWLLLTLFKTGYQRSRQVSANEQLLMGALLAAAFAYLIQNQFSFGVVAITSLFWIILAMVVAIGMPVVEKEKFADNNLSTLKWEELPWLPLALLVFMTGFFIYISFLSFWGDVWYKSARSNMEFRRFPQALEDFDKSLAYYPYEGITIAHRGITYLNAAFQLPQPDAMLAKAVSGLKYGTQIDPYNADNFYMLSKLYFLLYEKGDQTALLTAKNYAYITIKLDPYYAEAYQMLGMIYAKKNQIDLAMSFTEKAFFINPNLSEAMQLLEGLYARVGQRPRLVMVFDRLLDTYRDNPVVLANVARIYLGYGRAGEAKQLAEELLSQDPLSMSAYVIRAQALLQLGDKKQAADDLQRVLMEDPRNAEAHFILGRLYLTQSDKPKARQEFEQVLQLDPGNVAAREFLEGL